MTNVVVTARILSRRYENDNAFNVKTWLNNKGLLFQGGKGCWS